jgi:uncharacterized protein YcgI (DUF1989 family)
VALTEALTDYGIGYDRIPDPINWFMNVSIQQRGELEIREPLAEAGDYVLLRAIEDVVAAISTCPQDFGLTNAGNPTELVVRVYAEKPERAHDAASVAVAAVESAQPPGPADAPQPATVTGASRISPRPARLRDTVEATVIRTEPGVDS